MPRYQEGSIRQIERADGMTWALRYYTTRADGKRVEHTVAIGLVQKHRPEESRRVPRSRSSEAARKHQPTTTLPGTTEDI